MSGNPAGRPVGRRSQLDTLKQDLEIAVRKHVRAERVIKILEKMCDMAEGGDTRAAKLVLSMAVSSASVPTDAKEAPPGITITITNATFAAKAVNNEKPIEGHVIKEVEENGN